MSELRVHADHVLAIELRVESIEDVQDTLIWTWSRVVADLLDRLSFHAFGRHSQPHIARELDGGVHRTRVAHNEEHELELVVFHWKTREG